MDLFRKERKWANVIGKVIVHDCINNDLPINTSKLMKLLYFMQMLYIEKYGKTMFENEIIATRSGPCIPDVNKFFIAGRAGFREQISIDCILMDFHREVAEIVLRQYGTLTPNELVEELNSLHCDI